MTANQAAIKTNGHEPSYLEYKGKHTGILGWILSTDHKRIGILYLISLSIFFLVGVTFGFPNASGINFSGKYYNGCTDL